MKKIRFFIYIFLVIFTLTGCQIGRKQEVKIEKKDTAPESLSSLSTGLQELLKNNEKVEQLLDGTYIEEGSDKEKKEEKKSDSQGQGQGSEKEQGGSQGGQGGQGEGEGEGGNSQAKSEEDEKKKREEDIKKTWESMDKKIKELHGQWNEYEGEGRKKGASADRIEKFANSLNLLTKAIENKKVDDVYNYGSQSMLNIGPILELYKDEVLGELNKIKHGTYQSYLKSMEGQNTLASRLLEDAKEEISKLRLKLEKDDSKIKILDKLNLSLEDMQNALKENSIKLTRIKKDIIIKNTDELGK